MAARRPTEYSVDVALAICTRVAEGKPLTAVCRMSGMPGLTTVYKWRSLHVDFDLMLRRARADMADTLFAQTIEIADEKCADSTAVQRNRLRVDTRKFAAARMNPRLYGDTLAIGGAEDLPPVKTDGMEGAKRLAFILAQAGARLEQQRQPALPRAPLPERVSLEELPPYREVFADEPDAYVEESDAELDRIGDPRREPGEVDAGRIPLSRRFGDQQT